MAPTTGTRASPTELAIPRAATVLTLNGLNFNVSNYVPRQFGGVFARPPYVARQIHYPASLAADSIPTGVEALDAALRATSGPVIVLAHSQGAQVASHWMRQHAEDPTAPPADRLTFILTGNPLRAEGGRAIGRHEVGGTIGAPTPVSSLWKVIDVARRYDGWADWPADASDQWAAKNAKAGMRTFHPHYEGVALDAPSNTVWTRGTTTFVLTREELPMWKGRAYPDYLRRTMQAHIEAAYRRPPNDPRIEPPSPKALEPAGRERLRQWGLPAD